MTPDQMRDASLLELFRLEAEAQTQVLNAGLMALERSPTQADQLEAQMRAAHSLKGAARDRRAGPACAWRTSWRIAWWRRRTDACSCNRNISMRCSRLRPVAAYRHPPAGDAGWAEGAGREEIDGPVQRLEGLVRSGRRWPARSCRRRLPACRKRLEAPPAASAAASDDRRGARRAGGRRTGRGAPQPGPAGHRRAPDRLLDISSKSLVEFQRIKPLADSPATPASPAVQR